MKETAPHPARWSERILVEIEALVVENDFPGDVILDPFAGPDLGRLAEHVSPFEVVGSELEWEWTSDTPGSTQADALRPPWRPKSIGCMVTSCAYGNRMADNHDARDDCRSCGGTGSIPGPDRVAGGNGPDVPCRLCGGRGLSKRNTYKHTLGRDPSSGSSTVLQWGKAYRDFHEAAWQACDDVLADGALVVLNVSNHIRDGRERAVVEWHLNAWLRLGAKLDHVVRVRTPRQRNGAHGDLRVDGEVLLVLRARSVAW